VQLILGRIEQYRRQFEPASIRLDRAERLAPNDARILALLAGYQAYQGEGERAWARSEEHTSELQSRENLVCRLLLEKKKNMSCSGASTTSPRSSTGGNVRAPGSARRSERRKSTPSGTGLGGRRRT